VSGCFDFAQHEGEGEKRRRGESELPELLTARPPAFAEATADKA